MAHGLSTPFTPRHEFKQKTPAGIWLHRSALCIGWHVWHRPDESGAQHLCTRHRGRHRQQGRHRIDHRGLQVPGAGMEKRPASGQGSCAARPLLVSLSNAREGRRRGRGKPRRSLARQRGPPAHHPLCRGTQADGDQLPRGVQRIQGSRVRPGSGRRRRQGHGPRADSLAGRSEEEDRLDRGSQRDTGSRTAP